MKVRTPLWHHSLAILIVVLALSFLLLTLEVRSTQERASLTKRLAMTVVAPVLKGFHYLSESLISVWKGYIDLRGVRRENGVLREELGRMRQEQMFLLEAKAENERLQKILQLRESLPAPTIAARVISKDPSNWFRSLLIDKGSAEGLFRNATVLCPQGLVGRVIDVMEHTARVQLITDPNCAVGALIQDSRVGGVVMGEVGPYCRFKFLPQDAEISVGDLVLTSGWGNLGPRGIPVGTVTSIKKKGNALFQEVQILPKTDLFRLEEVLVLSKPSRAEIRWQEEESR